MPNWLSCSGLVVVVVLACGASYRAWPWPHQYFNWQVGGRESGHQYLAHGNVDWGEDLWAIDQWIDDHPDIRPLFIGSRSLPVQNLLHRDGVEFITGYGHQPYTQPGYYLLSKEEIYASTSRFPWTCGGTDGAIAKVGASHFLYQRE